MSLRCLACAFVVLCLPRLFAQTPASFELKRDPFPATGAEVLVQGDFNKDGKPDIIVGAGASQGAITLRLGNGDGTFQAPLTVGRTDYPATTDIAAADLNNDGNLDLVVVAQNNFAGGTSGTFQVFFGNGDGTFQAPVSYAGANVPYSVAVGDFNGDGLPDLAIGEQNDTIEIFNNVGGRTFASAKTIVLGDFGNFVKVRAGDFNGDGNLHLAALGFPGVFVAFNDGHENFTVVNVDQHGVNDITVADANQDGIDDILTSYNDGVVIVNGQQEAESQIDIVYGLGNRKFVTRTVVNNLSLIGAMSMWATDVNGDGIADIVASDTKYSSSQPAVVGMFVWLGNPDGSYNQTPQIYVPSTHNIGGLVAGDWNRDGMMDFAMALTDDGETEFFLNGGSRAPCASLQINPTVTVCQPVNQTYLPSGAVTVQASAYDRNTVTAMQIYDNYAEIYSQDVSSFTTAIHPAPGKHLLVVKAWDYTGLSFRSDRNITVYDGTPGASCPTTYQGASICLPSASTTGSPVQILANGWTPNVPTAAQLYIDGQLVVNDQGCNSAGNDCEGGTSFLNTEQTLPSGTHNLVFKLWDDLGNTYDAQKTVTVP